jgi:hypothetical protein
MDTVADDDFDLAAIEYHCRIGWMLGCPYRSCHLAGSCQAPTPDEPVRHSIDRLPDDR